MKTYGQKDKCQFLAFPDNQLQNIDNNLTHTKLACLKNSASFKPAFVHDPHR